MGQYDAGVDQQLDPGSLGLGGLQYQWSRKELL
jgi:hypothetical protein